MSKAYWAVAGAQPTFADCLRQLARAAMVGIEAGGISRLFCHAIPSIGVGFSFFVSDGQVLAGRLRCTINRRSRSAGRRRVRPLSSVRPDRHKRAPHFLPPFGRQGPRWRADMHDRMHGRWERRMHRRFGPGWANLSEEERERFRAGMQQSNYRPRNGGTPFAATPASDGAPPKGSSQPTAPGEQR